MNFFIRIVPLGVLLFNITSCIKKNDATLPPGVKWVNPDYSSLFLLGTSGKDSFIALKNPTDTSQWMQIIYWGDGDAPEGCIKLNKRNRIACMTAIFSGMMEVLGKETLICCTDNIKYHTGPKCQKWFAKSDVKEVSKGAYLDREKLIRSKPDLILTYFVDNKEKDEWDAINKLGVPVLYLQNYLENHPLARAEWLKVIGWLVGKPEDAQKFFDMVKEHYESLTGMVQAAKPDRPKVLCNAPYSGIWDVPAGDSYMAVLIADAGADYLWKNVKGTGKLSLDIEKVYKKARNADIWINPGACTNIKSLLEMDSRLQSMRSVEQGKVYNATKTLNQSGGNAWWDYAAVRPDLALRDLVNIFQPNLVSDEPELIFFEVLK